MKKNLYIIIVILIIIIACFKIRFILNDSFIKDFNNIEYKEDKIKLLNNLNYYEAYVAIKNYGDYYFKMAEYEKAIEKYDEALTKKMPQEKACDTRINACLSVYKLIDMSKKEEAIDYLKKAKSYVHDDDCLTLEEGSSSKGDAENMDEQIDKTLEELQKGQSKGSGDDPDPTGNPGEDNPVSPSKIDEVKQGNQQAEDSRDNQMGQYQDGFDPYDGQQW